MNGADDAIVDDQKSDLAPELHLDPPPGSPQRRLGAGRAQQRFDRGRAERSVPAEVRPLLEAEDSRRGLQIDRSRQPRGSHEAEIDEPLLKLARRRPRQRLRCDRCRYRAAKVVAGEEAHRDASFDQHPHRQDAADAPHRSNQLADAGLKGRLVTAGREA